MEEKISFTELAGDVEDPLVLAYVPKGDTAHSIKLSPLAQYLVEMCDGCSSISGIKHATHDELNEIFRSELFSACDIVFRSLIEDAILSIGTT